VLVLPEADYYTADGVRLEGRGVSPQVEVPPADAMLVIADSLRPKSPYAAALLSFQGALQGVTRQNSNARYANAERWAREALRLAPDSLAPVNALASVFVVQRRWAAGFALWDSLLSLDPRRAAVRYQIGRFAALSGEHLDAGEGALREYLRAPVPLGGATHAAAHWRLGIIFEAKGDRTAAREQYETGLSLDPNNVELKNALRRTATPDS